MRLVRSFHMIRNPTCSSGPILRQRPKIHMLSRMRSTRNRSIANPSTPLAETVVADINRDQKQTGWSLEGYI